MTELKEPDEAIERKSQETERRRRTSERTSLVPSKKSDSGNSPHTCAVWINQRCLALQWRRAQVNKDYRWNASE